MDDGGQSPQMPSKPVHMYIYIYKYTCHVHIITSFMQGPMSLNPDMHFFCHVRRIPPPPQVTDPYVFDSELFMERPWRKPGADMTDWFNYGFNEDTWQAYCNKQQQLRRQNAMQGSNIQVPHPNPKPQALKSRMRCRAPTSRCHTQIPNSQSRKTRIRNAVQG
jgi:hypothetical protein